MSREIPPRPSLEHLQKQAKDLLRLLERGQPAAIKRARAVASFRPGARPNIADAQHVIAREHGFAGWPKLRDHLESLAGAPDPREALVAAVTANDPAGARLVLEGHPELRAMLDQPMPGLPFGSLPLMPAVRRGDPEMIDFLLGAGADINARSHWWAGGFGVLDLCAPAFAPFLIERGAVVDAHAAARLGMLDRLRELVGDRPDLVHARGGDGQTPLHFAANAEIAQFLLDRGADVDARDIDHESTPAQYMVSDRQPVARFLVASGCRTDLLMAAVLGDFDLAHGHLDADPECIRMSVTERYFPKQDPRAGGTIYIWTIGANRTAHLVAREFGHDDVFQLLMERSPAQLRLAVACELGDRAMAESLLSGQPDLVQTLAEEDRRKLADAAQDDNLEAVRLMLAVGWPVAVRGLHGGTPLHWAAFHGNAEMVREILRADPPLELKDEDYEQTALGWALYGSEHGWHAESGDYAGTVEALLQAGASASEPADDLVASEPVRAVLREYGGKR